ANAVRDLLAIDIDARALLPTDESSGYGFDNDANVLSVSPALLERYMLAAQKIARVAIGDPAKRIEILTIPGQFAQEERTSEEMPFGSRGGTVIHHYFPFDGEYLVRLTLQDLTTGAVIRGLIRREQLDVRIDGECIKTFTLGGNPDELRRGPTGIQ